MNRADIEAELTRVRAENNMLRTVCQHLIEAQRLTLEAQALLTIPDYGGHD